MIDIPKNSPLTQRLSCGYCHATNALNYRKICSTGEIQPNQDGRFAHSFPQSKECNAQLLGAISLFDFYTPNSDVIFDYANMLKWSAVLLGCGEPTFIFEFAPDALNKNIISHNESKSKLGMTGGGIPDVEIYHIGPIPLSRVKSIIQIDDLREYDRFTEIGRSEEI